MKSLLTILGRIFIILLASLVIFSVAYGFSLINPGSNWFRPEGDHRIGQPGEQNNNSLATSETIGRVREEHKEFRGGMSIARGFGEFFTNGLIIAIFTWVGLLIFPRFRRKLSGDSSS